MKHIIFAGCSFSDDGRFCDDFDHSEYHKEMSLKDLRFPSTIKMHQLLAFDIETQKIGGIKIHTIARGSFGNHVIFDKLKEKISEIKKSEHNSEIYAIVQLSAFARKGFQNTCHWLDTSKYEYDYPDLDLNFGSYEDLKIFYNRHLDNIIDISKYLSENNIKPFIFFGWANIFTDDILNFELDEKIKEVKNVVNFYNYNESLDELSNYCAGKKFYKEEILKDGEFKKAYRIEQDLYGGLIEYGRDNLKMGERYHLIFDPHPSSKTYFTYYKNILKKWLVDSNILHENINFHENYIKLINDAFDFENTRFLSTLSLTNQDYVKIDMLSFRIISNGLHIYRDYLQREFNRLKFNGLI